MQLFAAESNFPLFLSILGDNYFKTNLAFVKIRLETNYDTFLDVSTK